MTARSARTCGPCSATRFAASARGPPSSSGTIAFRRSPRCSRRHGALAPFWRRRVPVRPSPSLADLQRWMRWALTHPLGVSRATAGERLAGFPPRFERPGTSALPWIAADTLPGRTALDRLAVYGNGYFARLHGTLQLEYPRLEAALGAGPFRELVAAHLLR